MRQPRENKGGGPAHVLFLIDQLSSLGGAERVLLRTVKLMPADRYCCLVATFKVGDAELLHQFRCPVHVFPLRRTYDWEGFRTAVRLGRLMRRERVAIVHTFFETSDLWGGLIAKLSCCPVVVSGRRDMGILRAAKHKLAYRLMSNWVDQVQAVSDEVRQFCIREDGVAPDKVVTLYNGIEMVPAAEANRSGSLRPSLGLGEASHCVVTVANVRHVKGIDVLVRTAAIVCRQFPHAVFLVAGEILELDYYRQIQELVRFHELTQNVRFLGRQEDIYSLLKICDLFYLPSRSEGFSNALLEAMACGLPCVATNVGGNAEAVNAGHSGFIVPSEDAEMAAERISRLLGCPEQRKQMGEAGRRTVEEKFTAQAMVERLARLYDKLLETRRLYY